MCDERDEEEAIGWRKINGEWVPIFEMTEDDEMAFYAAGEIGPEGLTIAYSPSKRK
jgi:hypothetical protein